MAAFTIGLALGIFFLPLIGLTSAKSPSDIISQSLQRGNDSLHLQQSNLVVGKYSRVHKYDFKSASRNNKNKNQIHELKGTGNSFTPTTINNNFLNPAIYSSVSFISDVVKLLSKVIDAQRVLERK